MPKNPDRDHWRTLANRLFLTYVRERLGANPSAWGPVPDAEPGCVRFDTIQAHATRLAVVYKNQFADFMAELDEIPDAADIRDRWAGAMREAEADIARYLATTPTPGQLALT